MSPYALRMGQTFVVGRSRSATIRLRGDLAVSRRHVELELSHEGVLITDLGSHNGTALSGRPLVAHATTLTASGQTLELGDHVLRLEAPGAPDHLAKTQPIDLPPLPKDEFELMGLIGEGASGGCRLRIRAATRSSK